MDISIKVLQNIPLLHDIPEKILSEMSAHSEILTFPSRTIFIEQEDTANDVYFIIKGSARVYRLTEHGEEITLTLIGTGDIVGEMAFIDAQPRSAFLETIQETTVLRIPAVQFEAMVYAYPKLLLLLMQDLSRRIRQNNQNFEDSRSKSLYERTYTILLSLSHYFIHQSVPLSHEELAHIVGATRSRITEVLHMLENDKRIVLSHKQIKVL